MTDKKPVNRLNNRAVWGPLLSFGMSLLVLVGLWWLFEKRETAHLEVSTSVTAEQLDLRLETWIESRLEFLEFLGRVHSSRGRVDPDRFREMAQQTIDFAPGFQAINWIDPDWVIRVIVPEIGNEPALGFDLHQHPSPDVVASITAAEHSGDLHRTTFIELVQGGSGFATYLPVSGANGELLGFINGVFRHDALIESCLAEKNLWLQFRFALVENDGRVAYRHDVSDVMEDWPFVTQREVSVSDHSWTLFIAPNEQNLTASRRFVDEVFLGFGIVLATLLALVLRTALIRQEKLRQSEARYRLLVENQTDMVVKVDLDSRLLFVSPSYCEAFGKTEKELLGHEHMPLVHPGDRAQTEKAVKGLFAPPHTVYMEQRAMTQQGWRWFGWATSAVLGDEGEVEEIIGVGRDITDRRLLEEKLLQSQKMEAIGQLAGGVAHDFNNILQAMRGHLDLADIELHPHHQARGHLAELRLSADRAAGLTRQLLAFGRRQVMQPEMLDLRHRVEQTVSLLKRVIGEQTRLELATADEPITVRADARQLEQILVNLAVNARDAMPEGGVVTIATGSRVIDESTQRSNPGIEIGTYATLAVRDSGTGMDEATQAQIFEPFFTTKPVGEGTGLGLATTFGIVKQHDGFIEVDSSPGTGTTITVFLPLIDEDPPGETPSEILNAEGGTETILLAEDDPSVRFVVEEILKEAGYRLISAGDGREAMDLLDRHGTEIDLAVLDVIMPGAGGLEVVEHLRSSGSLLRVLLTSGYSPDLPHTAAIGELPLLTKPFRRDELLHQVRTILDS